MSHFRTAPEFKAVEDELLGLEYHRWVLLKKATRKYGQQKTMASYLEGLSRAEVFIKAAREDNSFHSSPEWEGRDRDADAERVLQYARDAVRAYKRAIRWCSRRRVREAAKYFQD